MRTILNLFQIQLEPSRGCYVPEPQGTREHVCVFGSSYSRLWQQSCRCRCRCHRHYQEPDTLRKCRPPMSRK